MADTLTPEQSTALVRVAEKMRRAARNRTGLKLTNDEALAFALAGGLELATRAETEELLRPYRAIESLDT